MRIFAFLLLAALVAPLRAVAQEQAAAPAPTANSAATTLAPTNTTSSDTVVCKTMPRPGTRIGGRRECHAQREWDRMWMAEQRQLFKAQVQYGMSPGH